MKIVLANKLWPTILQLTEGLDLVCLQMHIEIRSEIIYNLHVNKTALKE